MPPHAANAFEIDAYVGHRVRLRRRLLGLSQDRLAAQLGLTFQQIQKYERGANRISASKLFQTAKALGVSVSYFFEGVEQCPRPEDRGYSRSHAQVVESLMAEPSGPQLAVAFLSIRRRSIKTQVARLVQALAANDDVADGDRDGERDHRASPDAAE